MVTEPALDEIHGGSTGPTVFYKFPYRVSVDPMNIIFEEAKLVTNKETGASRYVFQNVGYYHDIRQLLTNFLRKAQIEAMSRSEVKNAGDFVDVMDDVINTVSSMQRELVLSIEQLPNYKLKDIQGYIDKGDKPSAKKTRKKRNDGAAWVGWGLMCTTLLGVLLKMLGYITLSWWLVLAPVLIPLATLYVFFLVAWRQYWC